MRLPATYWVNNRIRFGPKKEPVAKGCKMFSDYQVQKEREEFLIQEFLKKSLGYSISNPVRQECPDALLTLSKDEECKRVAIEHTAYFNDTEAGKCSPLTPISEFWKVVQDSLIRRVSHRKHLTGIKATVNLKQNQQLSKNCVPQAKQLAKELVSFVEDHPVNISSPSTFRHSDFSRYPTLSSLCDYLLLSRRTKDAVVPSRCSWTCRNITTGGICLNLEYIETAIKNKNEKANNYNWGDAEEKWLLIAADSKNLSNSAGQPGQDVWANPKLLDCCRNSPFDKIVFWERVCHWHKWLKS